MSIREETKVAVQWWLDVIGVGAKRNVGFDDDDLNGGIFAVMAIQLAQNSPKLEDSKIEVFKDKLIQYIESELDSYGKVILSTDYTPDHMWFEILKGTGVSAALFPMKTTMWVDEGEVHVSHGYQAETKQLYKAQVA